MQLRFPTDNFFLSQKETMYEKEQLETKLNKYAFSDFERGKFCLGLVQIMFHTENKTDI